MTNILEAQRNGKSYFAHPARATTSAKYFPCLVCPREAVETTPALRAVPAAAAAVLPRHAPDADNAIFAIWDLGFWISVLGFKLNTFTKPLADRREKSLQPSLLDRLRGTAQEKIEVFRKLTGEKEVARRVDYR